MLPITDGELGGDEIEADERPHETREVVVEDADDVPRHSTQVPRRVRITKIDLARHGFTPGCPRCAELELGRVDSVKNHNAVCRARMYNKFETEKHEKYTKVRAIMNIVNRVVVNITVLAMVSQPEVRSAHMAHRQSCWSSVI